MTEFQSTEHRARSSRTQAGPITDIVSGMKDLDLRVEWCIQQRLDVNHDAKGQTWSVKPDDKAHNFPLQFPTSVPRKPRTAISNCKQSGIIHFLHYRLFVIVSSLSCVGHRRARNISAMYSSSNSFLGGGNSARPGPGQFVPSQSFSNYQQPPQQQSPFAPQPTGYGGGSLQPQFTGYPGPGQQAGLQAPQQQPQPTGFQFQTQQPQQTPFPQPQQQSVQPPQQQQQALPAPLRPQQTSAQIAQSFQSTPSAPAAPPQATKSSTKIPNIRLSFITATDQAKFEQLFKSAVGDSQALDGTKTVAIPPFFYLTPHRRES